MSTTYKHPIQRLIRCARYNGDDKYQQLFYNAQHKHLSEILEYGSTTILDTEFHYRVLAFFFGQHGFPIIQKRGRTMVSHRNE